MQPAPGVYNERFLVALDKLIIAASSRGLKLLLCLTNYWEDYGEEEEREEQMKERRLRHTTTEVQLCFFFPFFLVFSCPSVVSSSAPLAIVCILVLSLDTFNRYMYRSPRHHALLTKLPS